MRTVEAVNLQNADHAGFLYDLATACQEELLDDYNQDKILILNEYHRRIEAGDVKAFICKVDDEPIGVLWLEIDRYDCGYIRGGILPNYRNGFNALWFFRHFIAFCFHNTGIRTLQADIPTYNKKVEKLLRFIGFSKWGWQPQATMKDGKPINHIILGMTRNQYRGSKHVKRKQSPGSSTGPSASSTDASERVLLLQ